jgi:hypothetical protein
VAREFQKPEEIRQILVSGRFEELKGTLENEFFDAKSEPWDLNSERGKLDLAKDVSSLANLHGGIIVVGATTAPAATYQANEIQEIHPLPISLTPTDRYYHVVQEWVYPVPERINFGWHALPADPKRGLIGLYVPDQSDHVRPFLVAHYIGESGKRIDAVVGLVQRLGATTKTTPVEELHTFLREGRRLDEIHQKLDTLLTRTEVGVGLESNKWMRKILKKIKLISD